MQTYRPESAHRCCVVNAHVAYVHELVRGSKVVYTYACSRIGVMYALAYACVRFSTCTIVVCGTAKTCVTRCCHPIFQYVNVIEYAG